MEKKKISLDEFLRLRKLVFRSARPLDYTKWKFLFENGSCDDFLSVLSGYQNEDGGFGHNIECNNWNPGSSPYTVCIALDYLDTADSHESRIKNKIIAVLSDTWIPGRIYWRTAGWGCRESLAIMTLHICHGFISIPGKRGKPISE